VVSDCIRSANVGVLLSMFFGGAVVLCNFNGGQRKCHESLFGVLVWRNVTTYGEELFEGGLLGACFGHRIWYMMWYLVYILFDRCAVCLSFWMKPGR
jgi:ABC-type Mn2+/Zn2+ transport system permease subunit